MLFGNDTRMYLRVDIDENDAWRVQPDALALAFVRGNPGLKTRKFRAVRALCGSESIADRQSTERSDLRVLQVIYSFEPEEFPVYVGQQMDASSRRARRSGRRRSGIIDRKPN